MEVGRYKAVARGEGGGGGGVARSDGSNDPPFRSRGPFINIVRI